MELMRVAETVIAKILVPEGVPAVCILDGQEYTLTEGENVI